MKRVFIILSLCLGMVYSQSFEEIPSEDKSVLKDEKYEGTICEYPMVIKAEFPGGNDSLFAFLNRNMEYPKHDTCQSEKIWVGFVVEIDGKLTNFEILRGNCKAYCDEVLRVLSLMPKWIPQKESGRVVRSRFRFPIHFWKG